MGPVELRSFATRGIAGVNEPFMNTVIVRWIIS